MNKNKTLFLSLIISLAVIIAGVVMFCLFGFNTDGTNKDKTVITVTGDSIVTISEDLKNDLNELCESTLKDAGAKVSSSRYLEATDKGYFEYTLSGKYEESELTAFVKAIEGKLSTEKPEGSNDTFLDQSFIYVTNHTQTGVSHYKYLWTFAIGAAVVCVLAFVYFIIRFNASLGITMGIISLHDWVLTLAFISLVRIPMGAGVAAIGAFALFASIFVNGLVFEKMRRDFKADTFKGSSREVVYASLNSSKNLVVTTLALLFGVIVALAVVGVIIGFDLTFMMLGAIVAVIVVGYSSLVFAPSLVAALKEKFDARKAEKAKYNYDPDKKKEKELQTASATESNS